MSMIPTLDSCRFITVPELKQRVAQDNFTYKSVRVLCKIKVLQDPETGYAVLEQVEEQDGPTSGEHMLNADTYNLKNR